MKQANGNGTTNGTGAGNRQKEVELIGFKSKQVKPHLFPKVLFKACSNCCTQPGGSRHPWPLCGELALGRGSGRPAQVSV